jgi:hypothetical protein
MTGWRLTSSMPAMMRSLSSCFEATRMWRRTERANLEKNPRSAQPVRGSNTPVQIQSLDWTNHISKVSR